MEEIRQSQGEEWGGDGTKMIAQQRCESEWDFNCGWLRLARVGVTVMLTLVSTPLLLNIDCDWQSRKGRGGDWDEEIKRFTMAMMAMAMMATMAMSRRWEVRDGKIRFRWRRMSDVGTSLPCHWRYEIPYHWRNEILKDVKCEIPWTRFLRPCPSCYELAAEI